MAEPALKLPNFITAEAYLEGEPLSEERHEYIHGTVRAMGGASRQHELLAGELFSLIHAHLRGKRCEVFKGDLKLRIRINERISFFYPDVMVVCDPTDNHEIYSERPTVLIEVLSEDEKRDLVEKFLFYRTIDSLQEYAVIGQDPAEPKVYLFRRSHGWQQEILGGGDVLPLASIGLEISVATLYQTGAGEGDFSP